MTIRRGRRYPPRTTGPQLIVFVLFMLAVIALLMALAVKVAG